MTMLQPDMLLVSQAKKLVEDMESPQSIHFYSNTPKVKLKSMIHAMTSPQIYQLIHDQPTTSGHTVLQITAIYAPNVAIDMIKKLHQYNPKLSHDALNLANDQSRTPNQLLSQRGYHIEDMLAEINNPLNEENDTRKPMTPDR